MNRFVLKSTDESGFFFFLSVTNEIKNITSLIQSHRKMTEHWTTGRVKQMLKWSNSFQEMNTASYVSVGL